MITIGLERGFACRHANSTIILYRVTGNLYWNYIRIRIWVIKEPTWQFGDINQDGIVDVQDVAIVAKNYGKTFSLLSLTGIIAVAGVHQYRRRELNGRKS